ncbi:MAG: SLC13 family permease [Candidatus Marinimicrobia bacterium]|jgi:di/tricarboxylate transporter|nr:SLC13 family permease [Candidatus Neomarinimicrobiota bacterium]MDP6612383.1 SLC13 family permease [Candidatus Neomarinimicrobiota bacterium]|tara:strand:+ start:638 stop:2536 length:1899 start_codon:yes stop_codon:yes gene_type:complete
MSTDQIVISLIIITTFGLFVWGRWRYDIVSLVALFALVLMDKILGGGGSSLIADPSQAFMGFGHPAVVTVAAVLIISRALRNSGVVDLIARHLKPFTNKQTTHITSLGGVIAILSAFMNNVGALALMLPVTLKTAWDQKRSPSILLMPIAFASILGGMTTMIGTPPNIIISNLRKEQQQQILSSALSDSSSQAAAYLDQLNILKESFEPTPFGLFDFTPVGGIIAILGVLFVALAGWRLVPREKQIKPSTGSLFSLEEYVTEIRFPEGCTLIGKSAEEVNSITGDKLTLIRYIDEEGKVKPLNLDHRIKAGDQFLAMADPGDLKEMMDEYGLRLTEEMRYRIDSLKDGDTTFIEVVVSPESPLVGRGRNYLRRRSSNHLILMAVARQDKPIHKRLGKVQFRVGDVLLLQGREEELKNNVITLDLLPLAEREIEVGVFSKVSYALLIFAVAILLSILSIVPTTVSFIGAILVYVFSGILPVRDLYKNIDWPIIVLLGAMIPISNALQSTGTTKLIADQVVIMTQGLPTWSIVALIMVITMSLSDIINNAATALIMAPISVGIAISMGVNMDPFLMSVAVGASCAFLTPIGHQCNALILGPGGYRFSDYWRMGLPLEIIIVAAGTPLILHFWPL